MKKVLERAKAEAVAPRDKVLAVRLPAGELAELSALCDEHGLKMSELVRAIINQFLNEVTT